MAYTYKPYEENEEVKAAREQMAALQGAKPAAYNSQWTNQMNNAMQQLMERPDFKYDLGSDAMYKQYKDMYTRQGKLAMQNAMGQAAAMTGGYGNSYAQAVGQQQFQGYMQQLNDRIPDLYNMAMQAYQMQGQRMKDNYAMMADREAQDYSRYQNDLSNWQADRNYAANRYDTERDADLTRYQNDRAWDYNLYDEQQKLAQAQVDAMLEKKVDIPEELLLASGYDPAYIAMFQKKSSSGGGGSYTGTGKATYGDLAAASNKGIAKGYTLSTIFDMIDEQKAAGNISASQATTLKNNAEKTKNEVNIKTAPTADELRRLHN